MNWGLLLLSPQTRSSCVKVLQNTLIAHICSQKKKPRRSGMTPSLSERSTSCSPPAELLQEASAWPPRLKPLRCIASLHLQGRDSCSLSQILIRVSEITGRQHTETHTYTLTHTRTAAFCFIWDFLPDKRAHGELVKAACGIRRAALLVPEMEDESEPNDLHWQP